jgi:ABC-2 type transport system permease protein
MDQAAPIFWDLAPYGIETGYASPTTPYQHSPAEPIDHEFILRVLLGLLAVRMAYDSVTRDRESGILRTLGSLPISPMAIAGGKLLGGAIAFWIALMASTVSTGLSLIAGGWGPDLKAAVMTLLAIDFAALLYGCALFAATLTVTALAKSSARANMLVTAIWVWLSLLSTPVAGFVARSVSPARSQAAVESERRTIHGVGVKNTENDLGRAVASQLNGTEGIRGIESNTRLKAVIAESWDRQWKLLCQRFDRIDASQAETLVRQRRLAEVLAVFSPATQFGKAVADLAGTGLRASDRWDAEVRRYQGRLDRELFRVRPRLVIRVPSESGAAVVAFNVQPLRTAGEFPPFEPPQSSFTERLVDASTSLGTLAGYNIILVGIAIWSFRRRVLLADVT